MVLHVCIVRKQLGKIVDHLILLVFSKPGSSNYYKDMTSCIFQGNIHILCEVGRTALDITVQHTKVHIYTVCAIIFGLKIETYSFSVQKKTKRWSLATEFVNIFYSLRSSDK